MGWAKKLQFFSPYFIKKRWFLEGAVVKNGNFILKKFWVFVYTFIERGSSGEPSVERERVVNAGDKEESGGEGSPNEDSDFQER